MRSPRPLCVVLFALAAACATSDDAARPEDPLPDDAVFEETVVELSGETARIVSRRALTVGEARRDNVARAEQGALPVPATILYDGYCPTYALWLYDRTDLTGNRICFLGDGTAHLSSYWRFADGYWQTWEIGVGGLWPGWSSGQMVGTTVPDDLAQVDAALGQPPFPGPLEQVWPFAAWGGQQAFYGFILYNQLRLF